MTVVVIKILGNLYICQVQSYTSVFCFIIKAF